MRLRDRGGPWAVLRFSTLVFLSASLVRCTAGPPAAPAAPAPVTAPGKRTVLISLDGVGGVRLNELLAAGKLRAGGFSPFADRGLLAGRAIDVTPSLTPSTHISAITGAPPSRTGIVSHFFYEPGTPFGHVTDGFAADIQTETLWEAASRQGKRVGVVLYPGADGRNARRRGAFGVIWPERAAQVSAFATLDADRWTETTATAGSDRTFSPAREASLDVKEPGGKTERLRLVALDTTDDGVVDYDLVRIERGGSGGSVAVATAAVRKNGWFRLDVAGPGGPLTAWCRLAAIDPGLTRVVVYLGGFYGVQAYPEDYRRRLEAEVGGWPGPPDYAFMRTGSMDEDAHAEQATRLAEYLTKVLVFTIRSERWDLLLGYQPIVDEIEHAFEPGPGGGSREKVERAFAATDRSVAEVLRALAPSDTLLVLSDHGIVPLTKAVNIDRFFREKGWTLAKERDGVPSGPRRVQINSSSGIAHLYVDPALSAAAREEAVQALLRDARELPEEVIDEILPRKDLARVALDNPRSGDVVILLKPGIEFSFSPPGVIGPAHQKGGHGYRNATPELDAAFMALGPGIAPARPASVSILDIAPLAARSLGIEPPSGRRPSLE